MRKALAGIFILAVIVVALIYDQILSTTPAEVATTRPPAIGVSLFAGVSWLSYSNILLIGILLLLIGYFIRNDKVKWPHRAFQGVGACLILVSTWHYSGIGAPINRDMAKLKRCAEFHDCGPSEADIPTYSNNALVKVTRAYSKENPLIFNISGQIVLFNTVDCTAPLITSKAGVQMKYGDDSRVTYIAPKGAATEKIHVTLKRIEGCT